MKDAYAENVANVLSCCLNLITVDSKTIERVSRPEIELNTSPELILQPIYIEKSADEWARIELSINSLILSFRFKTSDSFEDVLLKGFMRCFERMHPTINILRKVPRPDAHISFLLTTEHSQNIDVPELLNLMKDLVSEFPKHMKTLKTFTIRRATLCGEAILKNF